MASSRDDFIIAIRSAFLKKSTQQKFSLLTLVFISVFVIVLSSLDFKAIRYLKISINEVVYRSSFVVSIPENFVKDTFVQISDYTTFGPSSDLSNFSKFPFLTVFIRNYLFSRFANSQINWTIFISYTKFKSLF